MLKTNGTLNADGSHNHNHNYHSTHNGNHQHLHNHPMLNNAPASPNTPKSSSSSSTNGVGTMQPEMMNGQSGALVQASPSSKALMLTNGAGLYKVFSTESVLNLLHCLYCKKPYKDPRLLHCGHTYCLPCLIQMNRYSTIRCIKCNSLQTVTSHAVDTLPKNLFVQDIQCIPTVEIDRGAAYKETLRSLEELKQKLLDFSDKFDESEIKLHKACESKKREVAEHVSKIIECIRLMEENFYDEIDDFKKNRLNVLRSAPPEFKETNANLLQFVNQSLDDMMRPDIKEEDVKEIYSRCEEHRRLWNETEIIFNSNYATGEIQFHARDSLPKKEDLLGSIVQKLPQKLSLAQRSAKGPISISECCVDGEYIVIENTSKRHDVNMTNWVLTHCVGSVRKVSFTFPEDFSIKAKQSVKLWAGNRNSSNSNNNKICKNSSNGAIAQKTPTAKKTAYLDSTSSQSSLSSQSSTHSSSSPSSSSSSPSSSKSSSPNHLNSNINFKNNNNSISSIRKPMNNNSNKDNKTNGFSNKSPIPGELTSEPINRNGNVNGNGMSSCTNGEVVENELVLYDIENWTCGAQEMFIRLENDFGEEKALFRKTN